MNMFLNVHIQAQTALDEAVALDLAVETAMATLGESLDETLIIVTADHAHTLSIAGYPSRGNSIIGNFAQKYL